MPSRAITKYAHSQRALPLCTPGTRLGRQSSEFQRVTMRIRTLQILRMRCKGSNFYANQHYFTAIISLSDSGVCPKPTADAPCSNVAHHSAAPRCGAYPSSLPGPGHSPGLTENVSALRTSSLTSFRYASPPHSVVHVYNIGDAGANLPSA